MRNQRIKKQKFVKRKGKPTFKAPSTHLAKKINIRTNMASNLQSLNISEYAIHLQYLMLYLLLRIREEIALDRYLGRNFIRNPNKILKIFNKKKVFMTSKRPRQLFQTGQSKFYI